MKRAAVPVLVGLAVLTACGCPSVRVASRTVPPSLERGLEETKSPPPPREDGRLPTSAKPVHYSLSLRIDPKQDRFSGTATIQIDLSEPARYVVLHARDLHIVRAVARSGSEVVAATAALRVSSRGIVPEELVLTFRRALAAGSAVVEIDYNAPFGHDLAGLYRVEEAGRMYAYTQFEATDARRAFPCFDEPNYKTPYDVSIAAPSGFTALGNSPETGQVVERDGTVLHTFATTLPLPSYLVAFAVGEFDVVEWQKTPLPIRAVTTRGRGVLTAPALEIATELTAKLTEYFAIPYPFAKIDLVAVPDFASGAMENPGLITFRDTLLLIDPRRTTTSSRRSQSLMIAHELAHQWFGNLVTVKWWDDLWLSEGFAMWAEAKIVDAWRPSFGATLEQIAELQQVMDTDALTTARAIREPVRSTGDAEEAFDGVTYQKGAAILRMVEGWLGPDVFRRGVQRYLRENAWGNATASDLFKALDFVSAQRSEPLVAGFVDHAGVPEVLVNWSCLAGGGKVELSQSEWRPLGGPSEVRHGWTLPVCVATDALKGKSCFTLGRDPIARDVGPGCPAWVYPNADEIGYYRFVLDAARLVALARGSRVLPPIDRLGVISNAWASVRQGAIGPSVLLDILPLFDAETNRYVVDEIASTFAGIDEQLVDDGSRDAFRRWVGARMATRKAAVGWDPSPNEDDDKAIDRRTVLWVMGNLAADEATLAEADTHARNWLANPMSVRSDTAAVALPLASIHAGAARLSQLRAAVAQAKTPEDRVLAIRAMGTFDDPSILRKALDLAWTDEIKVSELRYLFGSALGRLASRPVLYAWEKENWARLRARLPPSFAGEILGDVIATICTPETRDDAREFVAHATKDMEGVKRRIDQAFEMAGLCIALREHGAAEVSRYMARK